MIRFIVMTCLLFVVALPGADLNRNRLHKLIIKKSEMPVYHRLANANAIRREVDYGSYKLLVVDEEAAGGRAALEAMPAALRDEQNRIVLNGYQINTGNPQPLLKEPLADLKQSRLSAALTGAAAPGKGLYLVQFIGPIKDDWLRALEKTGVEIITYVPNNAYIVSAGERAAGALIEMKKSSPFVQWVGDYQPAYKLRPALQAALRRGDSPEVKVRVQVIDNANGELLCRKLRASSYAAGRRYIERRVMKYRNLTLTVPASQLIELARSDEVLAIEEDHELKLLDEAQAQIVAGNLVGVSPRGPGYLDWLASKGFNSSQFTSFAVNVVDVTYSLRGHPDIPDSRVAFEYNPGNLSGNSNHGFIAAHLIGGYNDGTGSAYEDANGFNYGLGVAPWARVGVTGINPLLFDPVSWQEPAYTQGARISSNSYTVGTGSYDIYAQEYDSLVRDVRRGVAGNQQLTVVFGAGNSGSLGETNIGSPGAAKNVITVGASENVRMTDVDVCGLFAPSDADSASDIWRNSSRGPVNRAGGDGRIKPDIMAPGTYLIAGVPQFNYGNFGCGAYFPPGQTLYGLGGGTSHATPAVSGGATLVYQDFLNKGMDPPSPAMIKAVLMNSASYMTGAGAGDTLPSPNQGMGLMNLGRAFDGVSRLLTDQTRIFGASGETFQIPGSVASPERPLRVTLAWTDAPGSTVGGPWVNDIDLEVTINGQTYLGNVFSGENSITGGVADSRNNVESVYLPAGVSGGFTVTVRAANIAGDGVPDNGDSTDQDFALVIYNGAPASPLIGVSPLSLGFMALVGNNNPPGQTINLNNIGIGSLDWAASDDAPWLIVAPASGGAPSTLTVSVDTGGLEAGTYNGSVIISSTQASNAPLSVPVTLMVLPIFGVNPSNVRFTAIANRSNPANQTVNITGNDSGSSEWTASDDAPWLTISPSGGAAPSTLTASVDISGLAAGTYNGTITIGATGGSSPPVRVPVMLIVLPVFGVNPTGLSFTALVNGVDPPNQNVYLAGNDISLNNWTVSDDAPWLSVSPASGGTPSRLTASVSIGGLPIGTYTGTISIRLIDLPDSPVIVPVTLIVDRYVNGGFEGVADPWILSGAAQRLTGAFPHSGKSYLTLGGVNSSGGSAYQQIAIPRGRSPKLTFWLNVTSNDETAMANDKLWIEVCSPSGRVLAALAAFSNLDRSTPGNYRLYGKYSLARFAGQTVRIQFRTQTNASSITSFRIDDVSLR